MLQDDPVTKQSRRQSWMTQLPSSRNDGNAFGAIFKKGGKSQFDKALRRSQMVVGHKHRKRSWRKIWQRREELLFGIPLPRSISAAPQPRKAAPNSASVTSSSQNDAENHCWIAIVNEWVTKPHLHLNRRAKAR